MGSINGWYEELVVGGTNLWHISWKGFIRWEVCVVGGKGFIRWEVCAIGRKGFIREGSM